jgi:protein FAM50
LEVTYSFFDGSGHRRVITVQRGDSIGNFLKKVREELSPEFKDLR